jgi:hypothetical protein
MVRVDDVHALVANDGAQPQHVARERARPEASVHLETLDQIDSRLLRLGGESVAGNDPEENAVAPGPQARHELDDRIGAARPPAVRGEVENRERVHAVRDSNASISSPTASAPIPRMHGWSMGQAR